MCALKYFWTTLKHKWFVFLVGRRIGCPLWRLLIHDYSKLYPWNLMSYGRQFYGLVDDPGGFAITWLRHQNTHDHHWEWWIPRTGHDKSIHLYPDGKPLDMSNGAVLEMVADWCGASKRYTGQWPTRSSYPWWRKNGPKILSNLSGLTAHRVAEAMEKCYKAAKA